MIFINNSSVNVNGTLTIFWITVPFACPFALVVYEYYYLNTS